MFVRATPSSAGRQFHRTATLAEVRQWCSICPAHAVVVIGAIASLEE
jgi:hypothetical protein